MEIEFDPSIFIVAQRHVWEGAVREISGGKKMGHWIWFIFPQLRTLGTSPYSQIYGLDGISDARSYLAHPALRMRLTKCVQAVLDSPQKHINILFDPLDAMKLHACLTLFDAAEPHAIFGTALNTCFHGRPHEQTLQLMKAEVRPSLKSRLKQAWQLLVK